MLVDDDDACDACAGVAAGAGFLRAAGDRFVEIHTWRKKSVDTIPIPRNRPSMDKRRPRWPDRTVICHVDKMGNAVRNCPPHNSYISHNGIRIDPFPTGTSRHIADRNYSPCMLGVFWANRPKRRCFGDSGPIRFGKCYAA